MAFSKFFRKASKYEKGQSLAEYGLILALVGVACVAALGNLKTGINQKYTRVGDCLAATGAAVATRCVP